MTLVFEVIEAFLVIDVVYCYNAADFQIYKPLAGKRCPSESILFERKVNSSLSCALVATGEDGCVGFSYHRVSGMCYGCDTFLDLTGSFPDLAGALFYRRLKSAPVGFFYAAGYILRVFAHESVTYDQAHGACATFGQLVRIDTPEKQKSIQDTLINPENGFADKNYWIQCRLDNENVWRFDDGAATPLDNTYWSDGEPIGLPSRCARMRGKRDFFWDDVGCALLSSYICEVTGFP